MNETPQIKWKDFIPWLERQPRGRRFTYRDTRRCMICAFAKEQYHFKHPVAGGDIIAEENGPHQRIILKIANAVLVRPLTCGNVLDKLKEARK